MQAPLVSMGALLYFVDKSTLNLGREMGRPKGGESTRQKILGIRLAPDEIVAFKQEALRRGLSAADLFDEIWSKYKAEREQGEG